MKSGAFQDLTLSIHSSRPGNGSRSVGRQNRPFASPGFVVAALEAFHQSHEPVVLTVESAGELESVPPLIRRPLGRYRVQVDEIGFPFNPHVIINDPLLPNDGAETSVLVRLLLQAVLEERCATILLDNLPDDANLMLHILSAAADLGLAVDDPTDGRTLSYVDISGSFDDYLATRSTNHRWQQKKFARRAREKGETTVDVLDSRSAIEAALPIWFGIERRSWQGASPGAAMTDADRLFMRLLPRYLDDDEVGELFLLYVAGEPAAALRMLGGTGRTCVHTMHFDQRFQDISPGSLLLEGMMRRAFASALTEIDFHGDSAFFKRWATGSRSHKSVRLYKPGVTGRMLKAARRLAKLVR